MGCRFIHNECCRCRYLSLRVELKTTVGTKHPKNCVSKLLNIIFHIKSVLKSTEINEKLALM